MRISRITLLNWKNFRQVDVRLPYRIFLVGPNASGKSNFLDALRFLRDIALPEGGFQKACADREGVSKIRCLAARQDPEIGISVELAEEDAVLWRYEIKFNQQVRGYRLPQLTREVVYRNDEMVLGRPNREDKEDELRLTQTALEQVNFNREFREIAQFFAKISYLHLVPQVVRSGGDLGGKSPLADAYGQRFLDRVAETTPKTRDARLRRIHEVLKVAVPQLQSLRLERDEQGQPHLVGVYEHWRAKGAKQNETQFSDGTLRLFGLLWAFQEGDGPLLLEEPELSLHTAVVRRLPGMIYRIQRAQKKALRQVFISTHSVDLLSDSGIGGEEILLLSPSAEGTEVGVASDIDEIRALLEAGMTPAEAVIPHTEPARVEQLRMFNL